jgi:hypothetical protein
LTHNSAQNIAVELLFSGIISWCQGGVGVEVLAFDGCFENLPLNESKTFAFNQSKTLPVVKAVFLQVSLHRCSRFGNKSTNIGTKRRVDQST